ncbi:MAG TPA: hypothetical protein VFC68_00320, partial [Treponemataceae bacterium]|nr:hypothetical protein [Treponemataceae bacterium]
MTSGQKIAASFFISILIFAIVTIFAFVGLFSFFETRFYQSSKINIIQQELDSVSLSLDEYIDVYVQRFSQFSAQKALESVMQSEQTDADIKKRADLYGQLVTGGTKGLTGIRIIRNNGKNIDYSTYSTDMLTQDSTKLSYQSYDQLYINGSPELEYTIVQCTQDRRFKILFDSNNNRIIYTYPFFDNNKLYRGTVLFYVNGSDFSRYLRDKNIIGLTDEYVMGGSINKPFFVKGFESSLKENMNDFLIENWNKGSLNNVKFTHSLDQDSHSWILFTNTKASAYIAALYSEEVFLFPTIVTVLLLL